MSLAWWVGGYFRWCSSGQIFNGWRYGAAKYQDQVLMKGWVLPYCFTHRTYMPLFRSWCIVTFSMVANNWINWNWAVWQGVANLKGLTESSKPSLLWAIWGGPIERYNHGMWNVLYVQMPVNLLFDKACQLYLQRFTWSSIFLEYQLVGNI